MKPSDPMKKILLRTWLPVFFKF